MSSNNFDIIIIGAGLSGIGAARYLQKFCPTKRFCILEMRNVIGGTWDLFRYPGIRSDSDMYTLGHKLDPWRGVKAIADGESILNYINDIAENNNINKTIHFNQKVTTLDWNSKQQRWTITTENPETGQQQNYNSQFVLSCSGYYNYSQGYTPEFEGADTFKGSIIHPQHWTQDLDYCNKLIVVIGSGATAVTLVPSLAEKASKVVMLQRSPTYILSRPSIDVIAGFIRKIFPEALSHRLVRWKNILGSMYLFSISKSRPAQIKKWIMGDIKRHLGDNYEAKHFDPKYNPWDERLCLVPDADLFQAINDGKAEIITDHIERFTETGVALKSGKELKADIIITATGLEVKILSDAVLTVDGKQLPISERYVYRGILLDSIPNFAFITGYTNASWTLKANLINEYFCRLINYMDNQGYKQCTAKIPDDLQEGGSIMNLSSGYLQRSLDKFPRQGMKKPWVNNQNYFKDIINFRYSSVNTKHLEYL